ncbi:hypothetical protein LOZ55_003061 [Ophidiomyces ophidiicola]|nr:hypothetical protein LOZ55_003061 [Ophidiomyces ophidiicola]
MTSLAVPDTGLILLRPDSPPDSPQRPAQVLRLNLAQNTLDDLLDSLRNDQNARVRLGKQPSLFWGAQAQPIYPYPENHRSELYLSSLDARENLYFSGIFSHSLEVQRAKEATAATDDALANLEQSLSAFRHGKESKKTPVITADQMRALRAGDNRTATGREAASLARMSTSKADIEKEKFFKNAASRSSPASPAFLAAQSPALTPTSASVSQSKDKVRLEALRTPLLHLLAVRPVSVKFLAQKTRSSQEDCLTLVRRYGTENRLNREKYDLRDKVYKDLDIWSFPYPSDDERQEAIDNAISAFDRMRLSKQDKLWQMLLPKNERGKGKVLSRLNLRTCPPPKSVTPRIHVQPSPDETKEESGTGNESDVPMNGVATPNTPADADTAANKKPGPSGLKKKPAATAKRAAAPKPKGTTTIAGKVTKKTEKAPDKKNAAKSDAKFKSAEFVVDSDDDAEMADSKPTRTKSPNNVKASQKSPAIQQRKPSAALKSPAMTPKVSENGPIPKSQASKTWQQANNRSPQKRSPLGSSPPTNASDIDSGSRPSSTNQSSSSSSPLMLQHPRQRATAGAKPAMSNAAKPAQRTASLKRKAENDPEITTTIRNGGGGGVGLGIRHAGSTPDLQQQQHKRRRPSTVSSSDCTSGNRTPPTSIALLRQRLREKSQQFKQFYAKYRQLHEDLSNHPAPPEHQLLKLERQHYRLEKMKQEIWDEDRRLR